jgi:hypothetical protein
MSDASIPQHNGHLKAFLDNLPDNVYIDIHHILPNSALQMAPTSSKPDTTPPARRPRRKERKSGLYTVLHAAQQHGITHPTVGGFLQLPREFDAILALEQKAIAQVVLEVLRQTLGTPEYDQHGQSQRREWATISQEHFARAGLMTNKAAWRGIKEALGKGYILRRKVGAQRYEYAIRWRGTN